MKPSNIALESRLGVLGKHVLVEEIRAFVSNG